MFASLRLRLTLLFVSLTVIPLVIVGASIARQGFSSLEQESVKVQRQNAEQVSLELNAFFSERENELFVLTKVYGLNYLEREDQRNILLALLSDQPAYYEFQLVNADGEETLHLTRGAIVTDEDLVDQSENPIFNAALTTQQISLSSVYFSEDARERLVTVAVPMTDLFTGQISQVLIAELRFQNIEESILRELELGTGDDVFIVDKQGVIVAHRNPALTLRETVFEVPAEDGRHTGLSSDDVILATSEIKESNLELVIVSETPYANAIELADNLVELATAITLITLVVAGLVVAWVVGQVVNPITKISNVAKEIQSGNLSAKADESGSAEISVLARSFNAMTGQLSESLQNLTDNVQKLEAAQVEREKLIQDLQFAKRMAEENSRLKSEFLSTMSHELRTPMNAIEGFTGIMLKRMGGVEYNEKSERYLHKVQSNSRRLLGLINDFLDLSRIESGRVDLANLPITLVDLVNRWRSDLGVLAETKHLDFEVTIDPDLPAVIYGDEEALSKVVTNLLGNATKFTPEGKVALAVERRNGNLAIAVTDTGIGIPPHAREFIFDEFRQVDQSSKRVYGGTGLGLAIVQKLTREMKGTVSLESEVGKGSTFTVLLPLQTEAV